MAVVKSILTSIVKRTKGVGLDLIYFIVDVLGKVAKLSNPTLSDLGSVPL